MHAQAIYDELRPGARKRFLSAYGRLNGAAAAAALAAGHQRGGLAVPVRGAAHPEAASAGATAVSRAGGAPAGAEWSPGPGGGTHTVARAGEDPAAGRRE